MSNIDLKPCPFCGGEAVIEHHQWWDSDEPPVLHDTWQIGCAKEATKDHCCLGRLCHSRGYKTEDEAIAAWNGRAAPTRTCHNVIGEGDFVCSECGAFVHARNENVGKSHVDEDGVRWYGTSCEHNFNYCPNCGARITTIERTYKE